MLYRQQVTRSHSVVTNDVHHYDDKGVDFIMQNVAVTDKAGKRIYEISVFTKKTSQTPYAVSVSGNLVDGNIQINRGPYGKYKNDTIIELGNMQQIPSLVLELSGGVYIIKDAILK